MHDSNGFATVFLIFFSVLSISNTSTQNTQNVQMTEFKALMSSDGFSACAIEATPYESLTVDRLSNCIYHCKTLKRRSSNAVNCIGLNYYDPSNTCQLFITGQRLYFVVQAPCRYFVNVEVVGSNAALPVCPSSFTYVSDVKSCYMYVRTNLDWNMAALYCQALVPGGHLAFLETSPEAQAMPNILTTATETECNLDGFFGLGWWIGFQFLDPSAEVSPFYWKLNSTSAIEPITYGYWRPGQPDNAGFNERCGEITCTFDWNDAPCNTPLCFVCQLDL